MAGKVPVLKQDLVFDATPTPGSENAVTSGGVAEAVGNVAEQTEQDMKDMEEMFLVNLPCAANTLRFEFSKMDYDPTVAGVGSNGTWKKVNAKFHNVWDWTKIDTTFANAFENAFKSSDNLVSVIAAGDTSAITNMYHMFYGCTSLTSVCLFDTSAVTNMQSMFFECTSLTSVCLFDTSAVTNMSVMFQGCTSLTSVPLFDTSAVTIIYNMFYGCTSLTSVPLFDTSAVTNIGAMFQSCTKVEGGALALYQQASTQQTPPANHNNVFKDCGKDTATGAAELAQIPSDWGGTAPATLNMGAPQNLTEPLSPSVIDDGDDSLTK